MYSIFPFLAKWHRLQNALPCYELTYSVSQRTCLPQPGGQSMSVIRKSFKILAPGNSLQRRTAYSLALVRLILAPVIFLAVYYLFRTGWIVDRIVNVDAPASALAQQASIEMLEARRAERNYLLLHDATDLATNHDAVAKTEQTLEDIQHLETNEIETVQKASQALALYRQQFAQAVALAERPGQTSTDRVQSVVRDYERDLDNLLKHSGRFSREHLMEELRQRVNSFDTQISKTTEETNPDMQRVTQDLQISSDQILSKTSELESLNWTHVKDDHADARKLLHEAEWALSIVSAITLLVSIWVSYTLPRQVIKPLLSLKEAVDHAAQGNYEIDFDVQGKGEIVDLVESLQRMLTSIRSKVSTARNIRVS
jgi:nitrogen fixation/metabolism regulation signal transduction histidine kinase